MKTRNLESDLKFMRSCLAESQAQLWGELKVIRLRNKALKLKAWLKSGLENGGRNAE